MPDGFGLIGTTMYATIEDRLLANSKTAKVSKHVKTACRVWTGNVNNSGYARYTVRCGEHVTKVYAYRTAWELANGQPIPKGMEVDHKCVVTRCIKASHLELVTPEENRRRRDERRAARMQ
jgi:hypothetical protein